MPEGWSRSGLLALEGNGRQPLCLEQQVERLADQLLLGFVALGGQHPQLTLHAWAEIALDPLHALVVIPTRAAILDLRAIRATVEIARRAKARSVVVLNAVPAGRGVAEASIVSEARRALAAYGLPLAPVVVTQRAALSHALNDGRAVTEFEPDGKASAELQTLWSWLDDQARATSA